MTTIRDMTNTIEEWPREWEQSLLFHGVPVPDNESFYTKVKKEIMIISIYTKIKRCFVQIFCRSTRYAT